MGKNEEKMNSKIDYNFSKNTNIIVNEKIKVIEKNTKINRNNYPKHDSFSFSKEIIKFGDKEEEIFQFLLVEIIFFNNL